MKKLFSGKLDDTVLFAFDDIRDRDVIERKLDLLNRAVPVHKRIKFYVLCGFDRAGLWKPDFLGTGYPGHTGACEDSDAL